MCICMYIVYTAVCLVYIFNLQFYKNNCILFSAFWLWIRKIFDWNTQKNCSEARAWFRSVAAIIVILVLNSKNYKWMYGNEKHRHISFYFVNEWKCVWFVWNEWLAKYITHTHTYSQWWSGSNENAERFKVFRKINLEIGLYKYVYRQKARLYREIVRSNMMRSWWGW